MHLSEFNTCRSGVRSPETLLKKTHIDDLEGSENIMSRLKK